MTRPPAACGQISTGLTNAWLSGCPSALTARARRRLLRRCIWRIPASQAANGTQDPCALLPPALLSDAALTAVWHVVQHDLSAGVV